MNKKKAGIWVPVASPLAAPLSSGFNRSIGIPSDAVAAWIYTDTSARPAVDVGDTVLLDQVPGRTNRARVNGTVLDCNGTNQQVTFNEGNVPQWNVGDDYSVVIWFQTSQTGGSYFQLWENTKNTSNRHGAKLLTSTGLVTFSTYNGSAYTGVQSSITGYNDGQWHCCVCVSDGGVLSLYLDGVDVSEAAAGGNLQATKLCNLGYLSNGAFYGDGRYSQFAMYDRVLSSTEIYAIASAQCRPWDVVNLPGDYVFYCPLESFDTTNSAVYSVRGSNGVLVNYAAGMNATAVDAPFSHRNHHGTQTVYRYNGTTNYHTTGFSTADIPASGSAEWYFMCHTLPGSANGFYNGAAASGGGSERFFAGVLTSVSNRKATIGFGTVAAGTTGASSYTVDEGDFIGLKVDWNGTTCNMYLKKNNETTWTRYLTNQAYTHSFGSRACLLGAYSNAGTPASFGNLTMIRFAVFDSTGAAVYDTAVDGFGTGTSSPTAVQWHNDQDDLMSFTDADNGLGGHAKLNGTISGYVAGDPILRTADTIDIDGVASDPALNGQVLPTSHAHAASLAGYSLIKGADNGTLESKFHITKPRYGKVLIVGNSLSNYSGPRNLLAAPGWSWESIHSNTSMTDLVADPTTNLQGDSFRWDLCLAASPVDVLVVQPFTADTGGSADENSPTFGGERDAIQQVIDAASQLKRVVIFTGYNRQADHATDRVNAGPFVDNDPMIYCEFFFHQLRGEIMDNNPRVDVVLCDVWSMYDAIYDDIVAVTSYYAAWANLYSDGTHPAGNVGRLSNAALRRAIHPVEAVNPASYRGAPWAAISGAEADYQDAIVDEVLP